MKLSIRALIAVGIVCIAAKSARAHPGSGIAVDRLGQVYFMDTGAGLWKIDLHGNLIYIGGPFFHWMALDQDDRFATIKLPSGAGGDITRLSANPSILVSSDFPIAIGRDGNLYYPSHASDGRVQIVRFTPSGRTSILVTLPRSGASRQPLRHFNGLTAAPDGSLYFTENDAIQRITMQGEVSTVIAGVRVASCASIPGMTAADNPLFRGLDVDTAGTVHVAASACGTVVDIARNGRITPRSRVEGPWSPTAVAVSGDHLFALEYLHTEVETSRSRREWLPRVRRISRDGSSEIIASVHR